MKKVKLGVIDMLDEFEPSFRLANHNVDYVVLMFQDNDVVILIPLCSVKVLKLLNLDPQVYPFPEMVVHLSRGHLYAKELIDHLGNTLHVHLFEGIVNPHPGGSDITHFFQNESRQENRPLHSLSFQPTHMFLHIHKLECMSSIGES